MKPAYRRAALAVTVALGMLSVVPGVAFAAVPACGTTIMSNTTLTGDMDCTASGTDGIIFGKKGLTLNLNGYTIWGPVGDDGYNGVDTNDKKHTTIKNGTIRDFDTSVYLNQSVGGTVKNLTLIGDPADGGTGVYVEYGTTNTLNNLTIMDQYYGFYMYYSANNWITNNDITGATYGLYGEYETGDHVINNYAESDYAGFYEDYGNMQWYEGNSANGAPDDADYGFYFYCDTYGLVTLINNTATGNDDYGFYTYYCYEDDNQAGGRSLFRGNVANDNDDGEGGGDGFYDEDSYYAVWKNNTAKRNGDDGFELDYPSFVNFTYNIANRNGDDGIDVNDNYSWYNFAKFANNKANYNDEYGIDADYGISGASGNIARHNGYAPDNCWNVDCN